MYKYSVFVYAICKNEIQFAPRWYESVKEADGIVVLDTGSTDGTPEFLETCEKVSVFRETISPWRFDVARNRSLDKVPHSADICVCLDLDEVLQAGWRARVETAWSSGAGRLKYRYTWNFNEDGSEGTVFWIDKIHARHGYRWVHPVHEVLRWVGTPEPRSVFAQGVQVDHHADNTKPRSQYLPLLELAVKEKPQDDRNAHYLGREYLFYKRWDDCINMLKHHLELPTATWADERCASMRYIARAYTAKGNADQAEQWLLRACAEAPHLREPWLETAQYYYAKHNPLACAFACDRCVAIEERPTTYITQADAWGSLPWDLLSVSLWELGQKEKALAAVQKAEELSPADERIRKNREYMEKNI
ncbi:MAG: glycosyltransferase [Clostridia bacterium]|nr:glycosyltransferase [Clostridia bacterium]